jgi:hypothetical protein
MNCRRGYALNEISELMIRGIDENGSKTWHFYDSASPEYASRRMRARSSTSV